MAQDTVASLRQLSAQDALNRPNLVPSHALPPTHALPFCTELEENWEGQVRLARAEDAAEAQPP
jgi:hypothetical protein